jgi:hypothetical protein
MCFTEKPVHILFINRTFLIQFMNEMQYPLLCVRVHVCEREIEREGRERE